jgi:hypothetical protein
MVVLLILMLRVRKRLLMLHRVGSLLKEDGANAGEGWMAVRRSRRGGAWGVRQGCSQRGAVLLGGDLLLLSNGPLLSSETTSSFSPH